MNIGWPQGIYLAILFLGIGLSAGKHGEPRSDENFWTTLIASAISLALLWWGGFFG